MIVMKFGGTSLADGKRILAAADIVSGYSDRRPVVVVSAMSGVTNALVQLAENAANKEASVVTKGLADLKAKHRKAAQDLGLKTGELDDLKNLLNQLFGRLEEVLDTVLAVGELTAREKDFIISYGERLSAPLMAASLEKKGVKSVAITADELITTDDNFGNAQPLLDVSKKQCGPMLTKLVDSGITPVITGYIGATADGITSTLGRGGSDYSSTIIGYCVEAEEVWIWTDVDGVMTADPRVIKGAHPIAELSYEEAAELSYFGAKVLHPRTMLPAALAKIPIYIKNTLNPSAKGTNITGASQIHPDGAKAMTVLEDLSLITVQGKGMQGIYGMAATVFGALAVQRINVLFISQASSENNISLAVSSTDGDKAVETLQAALKEELAAKALEPVFQEADVSMIAVVGEGMRHHIGIAGRVFTALGEAKINIKAIAQGSSERNISVVVSSHSAVTAVQSIHDELHLNNGRGKVSSW